MIKKKWIYSLVEVVEVVEVLEELEVDILKKIKTQKQSIKR